MEVIVVIMIETNTKIYITNLVITDQCDQEDEQTYQIIVKGGFDHLVILFEVR